MTQQLPNHDDVINSIFDKYTFVDQVGYSPALKEDLIEALKRSIAVWEGEARIDEIKNFMEYIPEEFDARKRLEELKNE